MKQAIPTEMYNKDGSLEMIQYHDEEGKFIIQAVWDENDEQTAENRAEFRKWAGRWLKQNGWGVTT
jgi:hypothetical protein